MSIKMVELDGGDMMNIIFMLAEMLGDIKKRPQLAEIIPDNAEELIARLLDSYASRKSKEEKFDRNSEAAMREVLEKVRKL